MPPTYQNIAEGEMDTYLKSMGFKCVPFPGIMEKVYAKRVDVHGLQLSLRIYTSISYQTRKSRKVGGDAIRCELVWRQIELQEGEYEDREVADLFVVGRSVRVHRTQGWKENLKKRIDKAEDMLGPPCPICKAPMVELKGKNGPFYGCCTFKKTGCRGTKSISK